MEKQERYHLGKAISTIVCLVGGVILINGSSADWQIVGLLSVVLSIVALIITNGWRHADNLPPEKKAIAYIPVVLGGIFGVAVYLVVRLVWLAFIEATADY